MVARCIIKGNFKTFFQYPAATRQAIPERNLKIDPCQQCNIISVLKYILRFFFAASFVPSWFSSSVIWFLSWLTWGFFETHSFCFVHHREQPLIIWFEHVHICFIKAANWSLSCPPLFSNANDIFAGRKQCEEAERKFIALLEARTWITFFLKKKQRKINHIK